MSAPLVRYRTESIFLSLHRTGTQDHAAMLRYQELIVALSPETPGDRIGRALLRLQNDDPEGGRLDLLWLLENRPRGIDLDRVEQLLRSLR